MVARQMHATKSIAMVKFKPVIRTYCTPKDGKFNIKIRISQNRKVRYIATDHSIPQEYMHSEGFVLPDYPSASRINASLQRLILEYEGIIDNAGPAVEWMDANQVVQLLSARHKVSGNVIEYARERIRKLTIRGKNSLADSYGLTIDHLVRHAGREVITFQEINAAFLRRFEDYFLSRKLSINTISIYMRNLRAIYNDAIDDELVKPEYYPFKKYKIRSEATRKRALSVDQVKLLHWQPHYKSHIRSVDLFLLSFYLVGINFHDMLNLKAADLEDGRIHFRRAKTSKIYSIKVEPEAMAIIEKYQGTEYLLNILERKMKIQKPDRSTRLEHDVIRYTNQQLKRVMAGYGQGIPVSTYYARHSWATIASRLGISRDVIGHALGHGNNTVTDIYIDFDQQKVDRANRRVIDAVKT